MDNLAILSILATVYMLARIWMAISESSNGKKTQKTHRSLRISRNLVRFRRRYPKTFKLLYPPLKWLLIKEQSLWAFVASYFFLIVIFFLPILIFIWVYFPIIGLDYGRNIANKWLAEYKTILCGGPEDYWNRCIKLATKHLEDKSIPPSIEGRLVVKNGELAGILTATGPITMSLPSTYYHQATINSCYKKDCTSHKNDSATYSRN